MGNIRFMAAMTVLVGLLALSVSPYAPWVGLGSVIVMSVIFGPLMSFMTVTLGLDPEIVKLPIVAVILLAYGTAALALLRLIYRALRGGDPSALRLRIAQLAALALLPIILGISSAAFERAWP